LSSFAWRRLPCTLSSSIRDAIAITRNTNDASVR
jgi:hypothetical protein